MAKFDGIKGQELLDVEEQKDEITLIFKDNRFLFIKIENGKLVSDSVPEQIDNDAAPYYQEQFRNAIPIMNYLVTLDSINKDIINCTLCNRLVKYTQLVGKNKVKRFSNQVYWSKPVTGFGDPNAKVLIIGLAPAAHGANRTGRLFTGDHSGQWLIRALHEMGFSNMPTSTSSDDGLNLNNVFITSCIRCAPPLNKPLASELINCSKFLKSEIELFKRIKIVITLGSIAFRSYCKINDLEKLKFYHLANYQINDKRLIVSYHPSRQNTNTHRLTWEMWIQVFKLAKSILDNN